MLKIINFPMLIIIILILLLAAMFTLLEYSVIKVRPSELQEMKQTAKVRHAEHMVEHLTEYLSTAQVGVTLTSLILGWIGDEYITNLVEATHLLPAKVMDSISPVVGVLIFTFLHAVFTDLVPKNMAIDKPVKVLLMVVHPMMFFHIIFYPFVWLFSVAAGLFTRMLGYSTHPEEDIYSQGEIVNLSKQSEKAGEMDKDDVLFMQRAFEMNDKVAADIMIDRTQLAVINSNQTVGDAAKLYFNKKFTRFPVVQNNDKDHILGYIFSYDIMRQNQLDPQTSIRKIIRRIPSVYENQPITTVLRVMIKEKVPMVVVQDEYGGTSGIITDKDIYEELFGNIREEIDHVNSDQIVQVDNDEKDNPTYRVSGKITLSDFERFFNVEIPQFQDSPVATLTGYFLEGEYSLKVDHPIRVGNFSFTPLDINNSYVSHYRVTRIKGHKDKEKELEVKPSALPKDSDNNETGEKPAEQKDQQK